MNRWLVNLLLIGTALLPFHVMADEAAMTLLEKMADAAKHQTYQGVFTYKTGDVFQSIRIYRRHDSRGDLERLISLNGPAREVIRSDDVVTCINPKGKKMNVSRRPLGRGFPSDLPKRLKGAMAFYDVEMGRTERVAGRQAQILNITPVDEYRYGYRLWVDNDSHLLLKSELLDNDGHVLEMFAFSSIDTDIHISDHQFQPALVGEEMTIHRSEPEKAIDVAVQRSESRWEATWLPAGFALVAFQTRMRALNGAEVEQRVYSDGLSSVSLFIEKIMAKHAHLKGGSHFGGMNAFGTIINTHFVTVVGEVPAITVEKMGSHIQYDAPQP